MLRLLIGVFRDLFRSQASLEAEIVTPADSQQNLAFRVRVLDTHGCTAPRFPSPHPADTGRLPLQHPN